MIKKMLFGVILCASLHAMEKNSVDPTAYFEFLILWSKDKELARMMIYNSKFSSKPVDCFKDSILIARFDNQHKIVTSFFNDGHAQCTMSYDDFEKQLGIQPSKTTRCKCVLN